MKILAVLTYYRPHTSGLTIYAERLAEAFARREVSLPIHPFLSEADVERVVASCNAWRG